MRQFRLFLPFLLFLDVSCGYRNGENLFDNVFSGLWNVDELRCYEDLGDPPSEVYEMTSPVESAQFSFTGRDFLYAAQINDNPGCQVSATGQREVDYYDEKSGLISFNGVSAHSTCAIELNEKNGLAANVEVPFGVNEVSGQNLEWVLGTSALKVGAPLNFAGSLSGPCAESCRCFYYMSKN